MSTVRTVRQLIEGALRLINVMEIGETLSAEDADTALQVLQDLLAEHSGDWIVPFVIQEAITLVVGQASYTLGENGTPSLNTKRPEQILNARVRSGSFDYPVSIMGNGQYQAIVDKTTQGRPEWVWYNPTAPNGTLYTYPVADAADSLYISSLKSFTEPTTLTQNLLDTVGIPRNYHNPLRHILAVELAPEYGKDPSSIVLARAAEAGNHLVSLNVARSMEPTALEVPGLSASTGRSILSF